MLISELMAKQNITTYRLAKNSSVPYATVNDIVNGKAKLEKCSAETIYKISKTLGVSMESLLAPCLEKRCSFELFKSNVCHHLKELGDINFIIETLEKNEIQIYYDREWYPECFYLLAMLDYISRVNNVPLCDRYNDIRKNKLNSVIYPESILAITAAANDESVKKQALMASIPEFKRFNIVESEIRNVI